MADQGAWFEKTEGVGAGVANPRRHPDYGLRSLARSQTKMTGVTIKM